MLKIHIDEINKALLVNVTNELEEKAKRKCFELLECPSMSFATNIRNYWLTSDKNLDTSIV